MSALRNTKDLGVMIFVRRKHEHEHKLANVRIENRECVGRSKS